MFLLFLKKSMHQTCIHHNHTNKSGPYVTSESFGKQGRCRKQKQKLVSLAMDDCSSPPSDKERSTSSIWTALHLPARCKKSQRCSHWCSPTTALPSSRRSTCASAGCSDPSIQTHLKVNLPRRHFAHLQKMPRNKQSPSHHHHPLPSKSLAESQRHHLLRVPLPYPLAEAWKMMVSLTLLLMMMTGLVTLVEPHWVDHRSARRQCLSLPLQVLAIHWQTSKVQSGSEQVRKSWSSANHQPMTKTSMSKVEQHSTPEQEAIIDYPSSWTSWGISELPVSDLSPNKAT